jgi:hypothetical protein
MSSTIPSQSHKPKAQATHDLRVYAQPHRAEVRFYRDNKGLEIDAIVEAADGRWLAGEPQPIRGLLGRKWFAERRPPSVEMGGLRIG